MSTQSRTTIRRGLRLRSYRNGSDRFEVVGFTKKPDGIRRARVRNLSLGTVSQIKVTGLFQNYRPIGAV
jgi:hypothetical protein